MVVFHLHHNDVVKLCFTKLIIFPSFCEIYRFPDRTIRVVIDTRYAQTHLLSLFL